ncbi:MAG: serine/threonine-protein kinase [Planctomycetaceae bacterium]
MTAKTARIKELFASALEIGSPEQREVFLAEVCQDDRPLRAEVDSLLDAHQRANDFLTTTVSSGLRSLVDPPVDEAIGSQIGPYTIREKIGEGGMGVVYVAEQSRPIKRKVALKLIKPGLESRDVIARFEAERQALALMEHPNIARVLDAGTTQQQRPYFVMELVRGVPITEYCDAAGLRTQDRLKLFMAVCRAVQHAHQKGIIHRDLKPSNVMVTLHDGVPVPKVIDFGVAKALDQHLTDQTAYTQFRQMIGTPAYMSPEQAEMSGLDVDTRSDVYALGVLLYELLTGTTPFDRQTLKSATFDEMRRIIREDDPLRPSQRVSTLDSATISTIRQRRHVDVRELSHSLKRELDWIVMKSLEKDRNRRYESASALAQDVQRYLNDEPVEACPPSTVYRVQKFISLHRNFLMAMSLILVTALMGAGFTFFQSLKAQQAAKDSQLAQADAEKHLGAAVAAELETRQLLYATDMSLAGQFWANGKVRELTEVLDRTADLGRTGADLRGFEWWLLKQIATSQGNVLTESPEQACLVRRSPDGRYLVIGWTDGSLEVRDGQDFQKLKTFRGEASSFMAATFIRMENSWRALAMTASSASGIWNSSGSSRRSQPFSGTVTASVSVQTAKSSGRFRGMR